MALTRLRPDPPQPALVALGRIEELRVDGGNLTVRIGDRILAVSRRNARELRDLLAGRATGRMR